MTPEQQVVLAAIQAAGPTGDRMADWQGRIVGLIPEIADMLGEDSDTTSLARDVLAPGTSRYVAHYGGYDLEASSQRLIVKFVDEHGQPQLDRKGEKQETIRTERIDNLIGRSMKRRLDSIDIGARVFCMKVVREIGEEKKVRHLAHIRQIGPGPNRAAPPPPNQPSGTTAGGRRTAMPEAAEIVAKIRQSLTQANCAEWARRCREVDVDVDIIENDEQLQAARGPALDIFHQQQQEKQQP